jgi:hypothetical protein
MRISQTVSRHHFEDVAANFDSPGGKKISRTPPSRYRCYDFKNIFAKKLAEKIGVFD